MLEARNEPDNCYDRYAIACRKKLPGHLFESIVGHLLKEISRFTYFIILHGARVSAKVVSVHHRRSPLVQAGLEIPIKLTIEMEHTEKSQLCIKKYEALIREKYKEPVDGNFEDATAAILELQLSEDEESSDDSELELEL